MDPNVLAAIARGVPFNALADFQAGLDNGRKRAEFTRLRDAQIRAGNALGAGDYSGGANALIQGGEADAGVKLMMASDPRLAGSDEKFGVTPFMMEDPKTHQQVPVQFSSAGRAQAFGGRSTEGLTPSTKWRTIETIDGRVISVPVQGSANQPGLEGAPSATVDLTAKPKAEAAVAQQQKLPGLKLAYDTVDSNLNTTQRFVQDLIKAPGASRIFGMVGAFPDLPGSEASNARATWNTIKSRLSLDALQQIREASKTGGALGNVSNQDISLLDAAAARLQASQSWTQAKPELEAINGILEKSKERRQKAYEEEVALANQEKPVGAAPGGGATNGNMVDTFEAIPEGRRFRDPADGKIYRKVNGQKVPE